MVIGDYMKVYPVGIKKSDKYLGGGLYMAASCLYSTSWDASRIRDKALLVATVVNRSIDEFRAFLDFPKDIIVRICPIKGQPNGRYFSSEKLVEIDSRLPWDRALEVLGHELVHAEQYMQGRLKQSYMKKKGWVHQWNGNVNTNRGSTYQAYRNQPWEIEAWSRQADLAEKVCQILEKKYV
jgi:hypothetical protein